MGAEEAKLSDTNTNKFRTVLGTSVLIYTYSTLEKNNGSFKIITLNPKGSLTDSSELNGLLSLPCLDSKRKQAIITKEIEFALMMAQPSEDEEKKDVKLLTIHRILGANSTDEFKNVFEARKKQNTNWFRLAKNPPVSIIPLTTKAYGKQLVENFFNEKNLSLEEIDKFLLQLKQIKEVDLSESDICTKIVNSKIYEEEKINQQITTLLKISKLSKKDKSLANAFLFNKLKVAQFLNENDFRIGADDCIGTFMDYLKKLCKEDKNIYCISPIKLSEKYQLLSKALIKSRENVENMNVNINEVLERLKKTIMDDEKNTTQKMLHLMLFKELYSVYANNLLPQKKKKL